MIPLKASRIFYKLLAKKAVGILTAVVLFYGCGRKGDPLPPDAGGKAGTLHAALTRLKGSSGYG